MGRMLIAILDNYQQADGSVKVPAVLQPFVGKDRLEAPLDAAPPGEFPLIRHTCWHRRINPDLDAAARIKA